MKKIIIFILLLFVNISFIYANNNETEIKKIYINNNDINIQSDNKIKKNIKLWEELVIDLESLKKELEKKYNSRIDFEWSLEWNTIKKGSLYKKKFEQYWNKDLSLNIYSTDKNWKKLIINKIIHLFIYKNISYLILDNEYLDKEKLSLYIEKANNEWVFINNLIISNEKKLIQKNILSKIKKDNIQKTHNYITVLWNKNFIFSVISQLNKEIKNTNSNIKLNLVLVSPFNTEVLKNYINNFISNKNWINKILLLPESSKSQIWLYPSNIDKLENDLKKKEYEYVNINKNSKISKFYFISKFINSLSNNWISNNYIYLIILIPFLFTWISVFKHLIWLSPIWIIIPIWLTLLLFQIWLIPTSIILISIILINLLLWKITNKYTLLYTPKISFIIIINLVFIMLILDVLFKYHLININITDTLFIILFIIISERFISIVLWKEFSEYKFNLLNTVIFALITYWFFSISYIQTIILAYPEIILILIPINFIIWKFTWLRITEYFRFKEVIKSIEE